MRKQRSLSILLILSLLLCSMALTVSAMPSTTDAIIDNRHEASDRAELTDLLPDGKETPDNGKMTDGNGRMTDESRQATSADGRGLARNAGPAETDGLMQDDSSSRTVTGIVLAVIVSLAIIVLILILVPKGRRDS